jgi:anti-anti-sigma factor
MESGGERCREGSTLRIRLEPLGSAVVLALEGRLTVDGTRRLDAAGEWSVTPARCVIVDMRGVCQLDCAGVGQLAALCAGVSRSGGRCALVHVDRRQQVLLAVAGLLGVMPAFESRDAALAWFRVTAGDARPAASAVRSLAGWLAHGPALAAPAGREQGNRRAG